MGDRWLSRHNRDKSGSRQEVRIIGGNWRRRKLAFAGLPGLRPTPDRVRETLFTWLQFELPGSQVLDLFAGSGVLGFEALSRGARRAVMVETAPRAFRDLQASKNMLKADLAELVLSDALSYLQGSPNSPFQVVFVDPPFQADLYKDTLNAVVERGWVDKDSLIYLEADVELVPQWPKGWTPYRQLEAGNLVATLLRSL